MIFGIGVVYAHLFGINLLIDVLIVIKMLEEELGGSDEK